VGYGLQAQTQEGEQKGLEDWAGPWEQPHQGTLNILNSSPEPESWKIPGSLERYPGRAQRIQGLSALSILMITAVFCKHGAVFDTNVDAELCSGSALVLSSFLVTREPSCVHASCIILF